VSVALPEVEGSQASDYGQRDQRSKFERWRPGGSGGQRLVVRFSEHYRAKELQVRTLSKKSDFLRILQEEL